MEELTEAVINYWSLRAPNFNIVRRNEMRDPITQRWIDVIFSHLPADRVLNILDVGTGTGYFAIILAQQGHITTGIDITPAMLAEAKRNSEELHAPAHFLEMNAQELTFPEGSFDAVISRNLTWTLPDPERAYREWFRVLKPSGILLNFDANHAKQKTTPVKKTPDLSIVYGDIGISQEMKEESHRITQAMPASRLDRPAWDLEVLSNIGFSEVGVDPQVGAAVLRELDVPETPMFLVFGKK